MRRVRFADSERLASCAARSCSGRPPAVPDDDVHAPAIAEGSEREPILSRSARSSSNPGIRFDEQGMPVHRAERERAAAVLAPYEPGDGTEPPATLLLAAARISLTLTPACSQSVARSK